MLDTKIIVSAAAGVILAGLVLYYFAGFPFVRESRAGFGAM